MRKIFLTSGLVVCMACPAFADLTAAGKVEGTNPLADATCQEPTLEGYSGTSTFTAKWTANSYTITYQDASSDTLGTALYGSLTGGVPSVQTVSYNENISLTSMTGSRTGYVFGGWTGDKNARALNGTDIPFTYNNAEQFTYVYPGDTILTSRWDPVKSGAITLISSVYPSNDTSQSAKYTTTTSEAVTPVTTSTLYSIYNNGLFKSLTPTATPMVASEEIPVKAGYAFGGFYDSGMTTQYLTAAGAVTDAGNHAVTTSGGTDTWYAHWTPNPYTVTYHPGTAKNGSASHAVSGADKNTSATFDENYAVIGNSGGATDTNYSQTGYTFDGWRANYNLATGASTALTNDNTSGGTPYSAGDGATYKVIGNVDMYAQWKAKKYQVYYESSTVCGTFSQSVNPQQVDTINGVPIYRIVQGSDLNNSLTYDAVYTPLSLADAGLTISTGYTFDGWATIRNGTTVSNAVGEYLTAGQAMASPWTIDLGVDTGWNVLVLQAACHPNIYDAIYKHGLHGSGNDYTDTDAVTFDTTYTTLAQATTGITADAGYTFCGWSQNQSDACTSNTLINAGSAMSAPWTTDGDLTLYAIYSADNFTITYNCGTQPGSQTQSGTVPTTQNVTQDGTYTIAENTCVFNGWHFTGWHCDYDFDNVSTATTGNGITNQPGDTGTFKAAHNITCTAQWAANEVTTTFVGNGGTVTGGGSSCLYDGTITLPSAVTRTGYTFDGWTVTNSSGSGGGNGGGTGGAQPAPGTAQ